MRMAKRVRGLKRVEADLKGFVDLAEAEKRDAQQSPAVDLRILAEKLRRRCVAFGRVQPQLLLEFLLRFCMVARIEKRHPQQAVPDNTAGIIGLAARQREKTLRQRHSVLNPAPAHGKGKLPEEKRKHQWCRHSRWQQADTVGVVGPWVAISEAIKAA